MPEDWDDDEGYWRFMSEPLSCNRGSLGEPYHPPETLVSQPLSFFNPAEAKWGDIDEDGYHFCSSTINEDGEQCVTWQKKHEFLGMHILREKHGRLCDCSYCQEFDKRWGIILPKCRCRNAWRILYWRKSKWPCELSCIRLTLPSFMRWRCRRCRRKEKEDELQSARDSHIRNRSKAKT